jgi:hypothetical protein
MINSSAPGKNLASVYLAVLGALLLLLSTDAIYWHTLNLFVRPSPLPGALYWVGLLLSLIASALAGLRLRLGRIKGSAAQVIWCCLLLLGYAAAFAYEMHHH